jgi:hypothetical protein
VANEFGDIYKITQGLDTDVPSRVADGRKVQASMKRAFDSVTLANPSNNFLTTATIKLGFLPFGALVYGGKIRTNAALTAAIVDVGITGVSGTTFDNDADVLGNNINMQATPVQDMPNDLTTSNTLPYQITDPKGAYVTVTVLVNSTATGAAELAVDIDYAAP